MKNNKIINEKIDFSIGIFGKPNAGKSTFLNTLLGFERSFTSKIEGTTSDYVIEDTNINKSINDTRPMIIDNLSNDKRIESPNRDKKKKQINAFDTEIVPFARGLKVVRLTFLS